MGERKQMMDRIQEGLPVSDVAGMFGVSRKTAQKWKARLRASGELGLVDKSRARLHVERFEGPAVKAITSLRWEHPSWGPRKLLDYLANKQPHLVLPAVSTAGELLKREGLIRERPPRQQRGVTPYQVGETQPIEPNDRWTVDFKGEFRLGDGSMCFPLTLRDAVTRKLLEIYGLLDTKGAGVLPRLERAFREYGLPLEMHSDTGHPFASAGLAKLSRIAVYLLKLRIRPVLSRPAKPQDNGGHERMHRDLKAETTRPPAEHMSGQQHRFDGFREVFNEDRPHEALGGKTPNSRWRPSPRPYPTKVEAPEYPKYWETRNVSHQGHMIWHGELVRVTDALAHERVGLEPIDDGLWRLHFASLAIGILDERLPTPKVLGMSPRKAALDQNRLEAGRA